MKMSKIIKKILILRFGAIGDVIHSTALFRSLKNFDPDLSIHYLTFKTPSLLIENDPDLDKVWVLENKSYKTLIKISKELKKEKFDVFINLQPSIRTKFLSFITQAKFNLTYKKTFKLHAVENFWHTAKPLFKDIVLPDELKLHLPEQAKEKISSLDENKILIGFNIGTSPSRQGRKWPIKYWKKLAKEILDNYDCEIILTGSKEDSEEAKKFLDISPKIKSFCGKLNIVESAALLSKCNLAISSDTGPLHIATAVGTPVIGLYGAAPISRTGPYGKSNIAVKSDRDCVPCNKRLCKFTKKGELYSPCLLDIKPDTIYKNIKSIL